MNELVETGGTLQVSNEKQKADKIAKEKKRQSRRLADLQQTFGIVYDVRNTAGITRLSTAASSTDYEWEATNREIALHQLEYDGESVRLAFQASKKRSERSNMVEVKIDYAGLKGLILEMERIQLQQRIDEISNTFVAKET